MLDKEKIIIIIYFGVKNQENDDVMFEASKLIKNSFDDSIRILVVPEYRSFGIKFECINPVLLNEEQYKKVEDTINEFEKKIKKLGLKYED